MTAVASHSLTDPRTSRTSRTSRASPGTVRVARRSRVAAWNLAATAVIWLTSLFVAALWVAGGGVAEVAAGGGGALSALGRLTGLVSSNLLLYQVLLMARVPLFERGFGTDPLAQLVDFVVDYPGMLLATAGTALVLLVAVTSIRRARRRLRYESWHLLHLYAYLGVALALPHQLWTGADFLFSPAATVYWWTTWAVAAASIVVLRVAVPLIRSVRHGLRVVAVERDGARGVTVRMRGRGLERLQAQAGMFFVWRFLDGPGWTRGHPFSLSAAPDPHGLSISVRLAGDGTRRLAGLRTGTRVLIEGPYGHLTGEHRGGTRLLMIGAGAGVAPLVSLLEAEPYAPGAATLLTRDTAADDALRTDAIASLVRDRGLRHIALPGPRARTASPWLPATHQAWTGPDLLRHLAPDPTTYDVYLCGPGPWMEALRRDLRSAGFAADRIHSESFAI
jgi:predicted ferric reductase